MRVAVVPIGHTDYEDRVRAVAVCGRHPGPRYRSQGHHSGEELRQHLLPKLVMAHNARGRLVVDMGGAEFGWPIGFVEEVFGGLVRECGSAMVADGLVVDTDDAGLLRDIDDVIQSAADDEKAAKDR